MGESGDQVSVALDGVEEGCGGEGAAGEVIMALDGVEEGGGAEGAAGEVIMALDGVEEGGGGEGADGFLPKMLFFEGSFVVALGLGALVKPPKGIWSRSLLALAYYPALLVLMLFGVWLVMLSTVVVENPNRRTRAKGVMWATLAPLLLVLALHVLPNPNATP